MATTKTRDEQPTTPVTSEPTPTADLDTLIAQQKALADAIKQAKAALPQQTPLEKVIARQTEQYEAWVPKMLANRTRARMAAGQSREDALADVFAFFRAKASELLASE